MEEKVLKAEEKNPNNNSNKFTRNSTIDFMKGICILFVVITHFSWSNQDRLIMGFPFWIDMAVPVFMLISGYVNCLSCKRKNILSLDEGFSMKNWLKTFIRYTVPFLIIFFLEAITYFILGLVNNNGLKWYEYFSALLSGGWGPGSYYYPILIQFLFIFPFVFMAIHNYKEKGLIGCFLVNLLWEFLKFPFSISAECYRLVIFRYIFLIAMGCYIALGGGNSKKFKIITIISACVGLAFIIVSQYTSYSPIIITQWPVTSLIGSLFVIPIFNFIITYVRNLPKIFKPIEIVGKASYNIFFVQMFFFKFLGGVIRNSVGIDALALLIDVVICLAFGLLFYFIETPLTKKIINKVYKTNKKVYGEEVKK